MIVLGNTRILSKKPLVQIVHVHLSHQKTLQIVQFIYVWSHCLHSADPGPGEATTKSELMGLGSPAPCPGTLGGENCVSRALKL